MSAVSKLQKFQILSLSNYLYPDDSQHKTTKYILHNKEIIKILKLTASLLELYGENQFKVRSYQTAVYNLERTDKQLAKLDKSALTDLAGVGKSIAATIDEINHSSSSSTLNNLLKQTPSGILELLKVKGIAASKIKCKS